MEVGDSQGGGVQGGPKKRVVTWYSLVFVGFRCAFFSLKLT